MLITVLTPITLTSNSSCKGLCPNESFNLFSKLVILSLSLSEILTTTSGPLIEETEIADERSKAEYFSTLTAILDRLETSSLSSVVEMFRSKNRLKKTWTFEEKKFGGADLKNGKVRTK